MSRPGHCASHWNQSGEREKRDAHTRPGNGSWSPPTTGFHTSTHTAAETPKEPTQKAHVFDLWLPYKESGQGWV